MALRGHIRPGGRSARVQAAVHEAVSALLETGNRSDLTIPMVAEKAGVTPSTIYRRWGGLEELLANVAMKHLEPDSEPADTGNGRSDLAAWAEQYGEEMASEPGKSMIRDILAASAGQAVTCCTFTRQQIDIMAARAAERNETFPGTETVIDQVVAPIVYRLLFDVPLSPSGCRDLAYRLFDRQERT